MKVLTTIYFLFFLFGIGNAQTSEECESQIEKLKSEISIKNDSIKLLKSTIFGIYLNQEQDDEIYFTTDSLTYDSIKSLVIKYNDFFELKKLDVLTESDLVSVIKLFNTINHYNIFNIKEDGIFKEYFEYVTNENTELFNLLKNKLWLIPGRGSGWYSAKYKIDYKGTPRRNILTSIFVIF